MKCIVLCAGYATRLYPLTENFPKSLLEVCGKNILDWLLDDLNNGGKIDEFIIVSNHKFVKHFQSWAEKKPYSITVLDDGTMSNETRLGAVKDILFAVEERKMKDDLLVIAGDNVLDFSLNRFLHYVTEKQTSAIMRYEEPNFEKLKKCGVIELNEDEKVLHMTEKSPNPASHWCVPPFYFLTKEDAALIPEAIADGCGTDAPGSLIAWLCEKRDVHAMLMPGKRYDIGNLKSYENVKNTYRGI